MPPLMNITPGLDVYVRLDLVLQDVASTVKRTAGALQRLTGTATSYASHQSGRRSSRICLCPVKLFYTQKNLVQQKQLPHTYRKYRRKRAESENGDPVGHRE